MTDEEKQAKKEYQRNYCKKLESYQMNNCQKKQREVKRVANYYQKKREISAKACQKLNIKYQKILQAI